MNMFSSSCTFGAALLGACSLLMVSTVGEADAKPIQIKMGSVNADTPRDNYALAYRSFAAEVEKLIPGQVEFKFFPSTQLGDEKEMIEGMAFGTMDMAPITNAVVSNLVSAFMINDMPFLYKDAAQAHEILDGPIGQELLDMLPAKKIKGLAFFEGGFRNMINNKRPVLKPADVDGVKFRVMQAPTFIKMFAALGGNAVPMPYSETFTAVQQGTVDGLEIPIASIFSSRYYEITKYLSLTQHTYSAIPMLISLKTWDKLSKEQQDAFQKAARLGNKVQRATVGGNNATLIKEMEAKGVKVNTVENPAEFRAKVLPVYEEFRDKIGSDLLDKMLKAVSK
ncbi:MAG: TRAP transporter substrate-binding protein [Rhodospirillales bacterium]|jgi:tripartite ATP-independent transporter DctP family solute receptor|nr:TRAP transporter substrate-binding protein [Rhodospirillales bacterium]